MMSDIGFLGWFLIFILLVSIPYPVCAASTANTVTVVIKDLRTKGNLNGALIYLDGGYVGSTSAVNGAGTLSLPDVSPGTHTLRVTHPDYREVTKKFSSPGESRIEVSLSDGFLVSLNPQGPSNNGINVVFYPSSTSYNCAAATKVSTPLYMEDEARFREDVTKVIDLTYLNLDKDTTTSNPLPSDYRDRFNFYYYYNPSAPADAFSGCAGTVPENYWKEVTFSDVTIVLYPTYYGIYSNMSCQPTGCNQDFGPGRNLMKAPADQPVLVKHETGHAIFGLIDTYCGETYYTQNDPHANVWSSEESCKSDARSNNRDPAQCRQIQKKDFMSNPTCTKQFWQWDPNPDIMSNGYKGKFGDAATQRINYVLDQTGSG
jgi:hypothetical protein